MFLKKLSCVMVGLICANAFAGSSNLSEQKIEPSQFQPSSLWSMNLDVLFLQPSFERVNAGGGSDDNISPYADINDETGLDYMSPYSQRYKFGFKIGGQYQLTQTNDLTLNWYHLNYLSQETRNTNRMRFYWDSINGEAGKIVLVKGPNSLRLHAGLDYSAFKTRNNPGTIEQITTEYQGIGPRVGMDMNYQLNSQITLYAKGAGGILAGHANYVEYHPVQDEGFYRKLSNTLAYVPMLDAKLGVSYAPNFKFSNITFDAGYMFTHYFSAENLALANTETSIKGFYLGFHWFAG